MEIKKFESGDGTIFLLNSRETRYLEAKLKTIEQFGKYMISLTEYFRVLGTIQSIISLSLKKRCYYVENYTLSLFLRL